MHLSRNSRGHALAKLNSSEKLFSLTVTPIGQPGIVNDPRLLLSASAMIPDVF